MNTRRTITAIIVAVALSCLAGFTTLVVVLGLERGTFAAALCLVLAAGLYRQVIQPWHSAWGATRDEVQSPLPGDDLVAHATSTTRAITIAARPAEVWPWLEQIGFGRGGWYSYDWIDNDGRPSAEHIVEDLQGISMGDRIPMTPDLGFTVTSIDRQESLVALSDDGSTSWSLHLSQAPGGGSRLVSRFRTQPPDTTAGLVWTLISDPGAFIMERRMLKGIRVRAERRATPVG